ncbi:Os08g0564750, partial [Oryza sativa Japonica Group]
EMSSPGGVNEWEDSPGEMESEAASAVGMGMMEVDADDRHPPSSSLPIDADFFNSFPDDFDDQDLA